MFHLTGLVAKLHYTNKSKSFVTHKALIGVASAAKFIRDSLGRLLKIVSLEAETD